MDKAFINNNLLVAVIIFIFSTLLYIPSISHNFVWDDVIQIEKEYHKLKNKSFVKSLVPNASKKKTKSYYRPLTMLSLYYDFTFWGNNSHGFHLTNIVINAVCSVLVFFLFLLILKKFRIRARENIALFSALLFAAHPMHVESVSWIAGRSDMISTMFFLAAFLIHINSYKRSFFIVIACILFYFSMLSKEVAVAFPFSILVYEYISSKKLNKDSIIRITAYFAVLILYIFLRYRFGGVIVPDVSNSLISGSGSGSSTDEGLGFLKNIYVIKTIFVTYLFYFYKLITPFWFSSYISEYPKGGLMLILSLLSFILLFYVSIISYFKKSGFKAFCILWLLLVLGPSIIISYSTLATTPVAERYLYLPLAPFSLLVIFLFYKLKEYVKMEQPVLIVMVLLLIVFSFLSIYRQNVWQDRITFWTDASKNTKNAVPHINLGMAYIDNKNPDEGIAVLEATLNSDLKTSRLMKSVSYNNLGIAYLNSRKTNKAKQAFLNATKAYPRFHKSYYHLGIINLSYGLKNHTENELEIAKDYFLEAIKRKSNYARAYLGLAKVYLAYGQDDKSKELAAKALKYGLVAPMDKQAKDILNLN